MVIGNNEAGAGSGSHLFLAKGLRQTRDRFVGPAKRVFQRQLSSGGRAHASTQYRLRVKRLTRFVRRNTSNNKASTAREVRRVPRHLA
jgi:hypothetical protein